MAEKNKREQSFADNILTDDEREDYLFVQKRIHQLQEVRKDHYGVNLDSLWADADKDYIPHRLKTSGKRVIATDEDKGWRGSLVQLGSSDWQSDVSQSNPFIKIQTALAILVDQNPSGVFTPRMEKYQATTDLVRQLYERSWEYAKSRSQLKLFVYNLAKYGWACARSYPLRVEREVKEAIGWDPDNPDKTQYEKKTVIEYNDIFRENLDPRNVWMDDMARPNNPGGVRDWTWRKVYDYEDAKLEFGKYENFKYVKKSGGITTETVKNKKGDQNKYKGDELVEVYFYENKVKDLFMVLINNVPVIIEPLPITDGDGHKKLSLWQSYWNFRHGESPYGVGIYEAIRYDQSLLDRISNMTIDQLTLSIYKMFFYQGTQELKESGEITIKPGVGKQVMDPKNIKWIDVPGPGAGVKDWMEYLQNRVDESSGITETLMGQVTGKTAFEIAQAKESALKRLKNPFDNILEALNEEAYITISLMQLIYSIPETYEITDVKLINDYLKDIGGDEDLYEREDVEDENGETRTKFTAKVYREFPLELDKDDKGNLIETKETKFFRIKPDYLKWEGVVNVKAQSILSSSKQVDKALDLEFYNMFIPLITQIDQERMIAMQAQQSTSLDELPHGKSAKELALLYDKDPRDIFPDSWFEEGGEQPEEVPEEEQPLFVPKGQGGQQPPPQEQMPPEQIQGQTPQSQAMQQQLPPQGGSENLFVDKTQAPSTNPRGVVGKVMNAINPFAKR